MTFEKFVENVVVGALIFCAVIIIAGLVAVAINAPIVFLVIIAMLVAIYFAGAFVNKKGWLG